MAQNSIESYSFNSNSWTKLNVQIPSYIGQCVVTNEETKMIYLFGGSNGSNFMEDAYEFDTKNCSTKKLTSMPACRATATGSFYEDKIYIFAGRGSNGDNFILDMKTNEWSEQEQNHAASIQTLPLELGNNPGCFISS